jgi:hypothetical protein
MGATHMAVGVVTDAQSARRRRLLHSRGDVNRLTADAVFGIDSATEQHAAGVHAHPHGEGVVPMFLSDLLALVPPLFQQGEARANSALSVVLSCCVGAEDSQHAVTGVIQHLAAMRLDDAGETREGAVHHNVGLLGIEVLAQRSGADDVEEQDGDLS